jgi:opacity protein-like surface antigen
MPIQEDGMVKKCLMLAGMVLMLSPAAARADWLFTPHLGTTFGGGSNGNFTYGASIGWMGAGILGWEAEFAFTPDVIDFEDDLDLDDDTVDFLDGEATTIMFNAIAGLPIGGTSGEGFRPYASGGFGWFRGSISSDQLLFDEDSNKFGFNLGGGAMGYLGNWGIRGDVRYYETMSDSEFDLDNDLDITFGDFDFWRGTVGVVFRW